MLVLLIVLTFLLPLAWLLSEAQRHRWVSVVLGVCAIAVCSFVAYGAGRIPLVFQLNTEFTGASRKLIDSVVIQLEAGNSDKVLADLKVLQHTVYENYEDYPRYTEIVDKFVAKLDVSELPDTVEKGQQ
jgi:hypothetical protein